MPAAAYSDDGRNACGNNCARDRDKSVKRLGHDQRGDQPGQAGGKRRRGQAGASMRLGRHCRETLLVEEGDIGGAGNIERRDIDDAALTHRRGQRRDADQGRDLFEREAATACQEYRFTHAAAAVLL